MLEKSVILIKTLFASLKQMRELYPIQTSSLFNEKWYLEHNPDVAQAKSDPAVHYWLLGGFEGRDPGPDFSSTRYLNDYADVKQAGINPLVHYLRFGKREGREIKASDGSLEFISDKPGSNVPGLKNRKIFCIGRGKTGTTSMKQALKELGYRVGIQSDAEILIDDWVVRDFRRIVQYCKTADAFQDIPFSLDFTYQVLDYVFPGSKFILTVRSNEDEWYESLVRFHSKIIGVDRIPTADDLRDFFYHEKGWLWRSAQYIYGVDESTLYDPVIYKKHYTSYNNRVLEYFKYRPSDLLVLNLAESAAMHSLCKFLDIQYNGQTMPHLNRSAN